ncbi:MAG: ABC transporter permease [archaeon]
MKLRGYFQHLKSILGLGFQLAKANFKLRNEGSYLGIFWYLLEPFLLFLIILLIKATFSIEGIANYPLYLLMGLIMFNFFTGITSKCTNLITANSSFIKSMKINYESLVISQVLEGVFAHFFEIILFILFMILYKLSVIGILFYPLIFILFFLFVLGIGFILSTIGVYINDLNNIWRVITRFLFFATPLFYVIAVGSLIYKANLVNPMYYFITISRDLIIYNKIPDLWMISVLIGISLVTFLVGVYIFEKFKYKFPELV